MPASKPSVFSVSDVRALFEPRKFRVLLVEDDEALQDVTSMILAHIGLNFVLAKNGAAAVKIMEKEPCDLILMDVLMPEMDGLEATKQIRKMETGGKRVPIIGMTGNSEFGNEEICLNLGMDAFISKPSSMQTLAQVLKNWLLKE